MSNKGLQAELRRTYIYASENFVETFLPTLLGRGQLIVCSIFLKTATSAMLLSRMNACHSIDRRNRSVESDRGAVVDCGACLLYYSSQMSARLGSV